MERTRAEQHPEAACEHAVEENMDIQFRYYF
jgi:hypothetical protein